MENKERNMAVAGPDAEELDREAILKWMEFFKKYPQIKGFDALADEVKEAVADGQQPEIAYLTHENKKLKEQLLQERNKKAAPAPAAGEAGGEELDAFARAFLETLR